MRLEWDETKNASNRKKHGLDFETAARAFGDSNFVLTRDRIGEDGEQRWHAVGAVLLRSGRAALLLVVYIYRKVQYGEETIRIVSAREADKRDRRIYFQQAAD
ncbi:MAG: BrnT family toxin [Bryobacteraceae bacterium]